MTTRAVLLMTAVLTLGLARSPPRKRRNRRSKCRTCRAISWSQKAMNRFSSARPLARRTTSACRRPLAWRGSSSDRRPRCSSRCSADLQQQITTHFLSANPAEIGRLERPGSIRSTAARSGLSPSNSTDPDYVAPSAIPWLRLAKVGGVRAGRRLDPRADHVHSARQHQRRRRAGDRVHPGRHIGVMVLVPYTTDYFFYRAGANHESHRRLSSTTSDPPPSGAPAARITTRSAGGSPIRSSMPSCGWTHVRASASSTSPPARAGPRGSSRGGAPPWSAPTSRAICSMRRAPTRRPPV